MAVMLVAMTAVTTAVKMALLMVERKAARKVGCWVDPRDQPKVVLLAAWMVGCWVVTRAHSTAGSRAVD